MKGFIANHLFIVVAVNFLFITALVLFGAISLNLLIYASMETWLPAEETSAVVAAGDQQIR